MEILQTVWTALTTENELLISIFNIPFSILEIYISMLLFTFLFNIKATNTSKLLYVLLFSIFATLSRRFLPDPYGTYLNLIIAPILIALFFKINVLKAIFCEFIPTILETILNFFMLKLYICLFGINYMHALSIPIYKFSFSIVSFFIMFLIYLILNHFNINFKILDNISKKQKNILLLNSLLGLIAIGFQMYILMYYTNILPIPIIILSTSTLITYFSISLYSLINTAKLNIAKQNLEETRLMNKTLTILNDKIRAFRHDFSNIVQAFGGYIQSRDIEGMEKYYSQLLKDCQEVNNLTGLNTDTINNPAIYSLLASKYYLATEKGIEFNLDVFMDLNSIDMKIYEFCRILGILLDNAIQATQECEEKNITVTIRKDVHSKRQLLIIENTYKDKNIDTEKIFEKGFSTKEGNTGLGLWEVRQILSKNTNLNLFTSKTPDCFKQQLEIYNEKK